MAVNTAGVDPDDTATPAGSANSVPDPNTVTGVVVVGDGMSTIHMPPL